VERKALQEKAQRLQAERNSYAKAMGKAIAEAKTKDEDIAPLKEKGEALKHACNEAEAALESLQWQLEHYLSGVPNIADAQVPAGAGEEDNVEIRRWGTPRQFSLPVKDHVDLGAGNGGLDFEVAAKLTGSRYVV